MSKKIIEVAFKKAFNEIDLLQAKIHQKQGFWFFEIHRYSPEDLEKSEHHHKIYSITEKLGSDVYNWHNLGKLSNNDFNYYHEERGKLEDKLHFVNMEITKRQPTWVEETLGLLNKITQAIMDNLPTLVRPMLPPILSKVFGFLPGNRQRALKGK
ncbi:MAG: hypothetical protein KME52_22465 [Desmonostoc geniculatum HA4340-LM1]|jgi:hypothetical protein|nr:hypothetical protein [Desmonostoc geniculatum HA4340-LM1]